MIPSLTTIQSWFAPLMAPIAPALMFGNNLYSGMISGGMDKTLALVGATCGTIGVELSGAFACAMAVKAYHKHDTRVMWIAIVCTLIYAVFVFAGIATSKNSATFASAVFISLIAYLMLGVYQDYMDAQKETRESVDLEVKTLTAKRLLTNAEARKLKAGVTVQPGVQSSTVSSVHSGQFQADPAMIKVIQDFWIANPKASSRQVAKACKCSPTTAIKYKTQGKTP